MSVGQSDWSEYDGMKYRASIIDEISSEVIRILISRRNHSERQKLSFDGNWKNLDHNVYLKPEDYTLTIPPDGPILQVLMDALYAKGIRPSAGTDAAKSEVVEAWKYCAQAHQIRADQMKDIVDRLMKQLEDNNVN